MDFINRSDRNESTNANNSNNRNNYGINFELPSLQLDLSSLSQKFSQRNIASNLEELMSFTKSKDVGCDSCGNKFSIFKRKVLILLFYSNFISFYLSVWYNNTSI